MIVPLEIEAIGDNVNPSSPLGKRPIPRKDFWRGPTRYETVRPPWVARLWLDAQYGVAREYLQNLRDYRDANSIGSRGIWLTYWLQDGGVYEVFHHVTWSSTEHYFAVVRDGQIERIDESEVKSWLNALSASTS